MYGLRVHSMGSATRVGGLTILRMTTPGRAHPPEVRDRPDTSWFASTANAAQVGLLEVGISPDEAGRALVAGIDEGRFRIFTNREWIKGPHQRAPRRAHPGWEFARPRLVDLAGLGPSRLPLGFERFAFCPAGRTRPDTLGSCLCFAPDGEPITKYGLYRPLLGMSDIGCDLKGSLQRFGEFV
jgi:hypothetical protein